MKSRMLFAYLIAAFLVSPGAFADIEEEGGGDNWTTSYASASADLYYPQDSDDESGWMYVYTNQVGSFDWSIEADAYAYASVFVADGWASAEAVADASSSSPYGSVGAFAWASISETGSEEDDPPSDYASGYGYFSAFEGVGGDHAAVANAAIEEGTTSDASCVAYAWISLGLG